MKLTFQSKTLQTDNVFLFRFTPAQPVSWIAGQSIKIELPAGYSTNERRFTIAAAPSEHHIAIATKISDSPFKQALAALAPGADVTAYNIEGTFVWPEAPQKKLILCASGVGITPYYAMLRQRLHEQKPIAAHLVYANRAHHFLFGQELQKMAQAHPELTITFLPGTRLQSADVLRRVTTQKNLIYLSGPSAMVDQVSEELLAAGLPESSLRRDWFTGRADWDH